MKRLLCGLALALAACAPSAADAPDEPQWWSFELAVTPVELGAEQVGRLRFRGGVQLTAPGGWEEFGGFSGLEVLGDGGMLAVTDNGAWLEADLKLSDDFRFIGVENARLAPMRSETGGLFPNKMASDSEGLAQLPDGRFAVSFEETQTIRIYDLNRDGPGAIPVAGPSLAGVESLPMNQGLEALASDANGDLIVGAEGGWRWTQLWRAPLVNPGPVGPIARYRLRGGYALVGMDRLPNGDFVALERAYAPGLGARSRITTFTEAELNSGTVESHELGRITRPLQPENFEGIAATQLPDGTTRLYIISDDNFSKNQRTLIYAFDISVDGASTH